MGYSAEQLAAVPEGANLGLAAAIRKPLRRLSLVRSSSSLGSGAGFDCFLAARRVRAQGRVIGVDMAREMLIRARANAARIGASNV